MKQNMEQLQHNNLHILFQLNISENDDKYSYFIPPSQHHAKILLPVKQGMPYYTFKTIIDYEKNFCPLKISRKRIFPIRNTEENVPLIASRFHLEINLKRGERARERINNVRN